MLYRTLGNTGLKVSEISFGTIPILQGSVPVLPDYFNLNDDEALAVMNHAYHLGCNLYDTAIVPEYGDAEIKLGKFASSVKRESIIISDKARFYDGNEMYQAVLESCKNLKTRPDIYFVHQADPNHEDAIFRAGGALDALSELKQEDLIRFTGLASHYYDILLRGAADNRVDVLQGSGNLLERGMLDRIREEPLFRKKGLLINKVYAAGILPGFFPPKMLIKTVLSYPISSALIGIGSTEQADAAMKWDTRDFSLPVPDFGQVLSALEKEFTPIPCSRCQKCRCPFGTEIHTIFRQYNYYFLGKDYWALRKLNMGIEDSFHQCRKCTDMPCLAMCPAGIRIPDEIENVYKLVKRHLPLSFVYREIKVREANMNEYTYITLKQKPELKEEAAAWFHDKWNVPKEAYLECMEAYLNNETENGWYLCLDSGRIIGGLGVIENDFHDRKDLTPNVCAVYTEKEYRCQGIAGQLLDIVVKDMKSKGITPIYLITDHTSFYERYGWEFLCMVQGDNEPNMTRMYIHR